jgi:MarR family transcriptional regulator, negative regulator of the multidrug operon emrRAB
MHTKARRVANPGEGAEQGGAHRRGANLLGAWSLAVADAIRDATERVTGLGGGVPGALVTLDAYPGRSIEDLRGALGLSQPGAVRLVDRLEHEGWAHRRPGDGRALALELTPKGRRLASGLLAERERAIEELLEPLGERDRRTLERLMEKLLHTRAAGPGELEHMCRLCERRACPSCPAARGAREAVTEPVAAVRPHRARRARARPA